MPREESKRDPSKKLGKKPSVIRRNLEIVLSSLNALYRPDTVQQTDQCDKTTTLVLVALLSTTTKKNWPGELPPQEERTLHPHWPVDQRLYCEDERRHITQTTTVARGATLQGEYTALYAEVTE